MPESKHNNSSQDQLLALIALEVVDSPASGPVPSVEEIDLWRMGLLPVDRADEVLSHLSSNSDCMRMLRQLFELDEIEAQVPSIAQIRAGQQLSATQVNGPSSSGRLLDRLSEWLGFGTGPMIAGGLAFVLVAVLVAPLILGPSGHMTNQLDQDFERWASESTGPFEPLALNAKSSLKDSAALSQLRQGALEAIQAQGWGGIPVWDSWEGGLHSESLSDCGDASNCEGQTDFYRAMGRWFLAIFHECESGSATLDNFVATAKKLEKEPYLLSNELGESLRAAANSRPAELCRLSANVLGL